MAQTGGSLFLQGNPRAALGASMAGLSRPQRQFFNRNFNDIYGQYQSALGQESQATGGVPGLQFSRFLQGMDLNQEFAGYGPRQRGLFQSTSAPRTRFLRGF